MINQIQDGNINKLIYRISLICIALNMMSCNGNNPPDLERPNIVFIMSDDHAYQAISAYQGNLIQTPHIDRLAEEGVLFERAFVTNSICAPSRAVILTGKHSHLNGILDNSQVFDGTQQTFPKLMQYVGYETAMIGKWHLGSAPTGFDYYRILRGQGEYYNPIFISSEDTATMEGYVTDLTTDIALNWLKDRQPDRPFCLMLHHKAPHRNWMPSLKHLETFKDDLPVPQNYFDDYSTRSQAAKRQEMEITRDLRDGWDLKLVPEGQAPGKWTERNWDLVYNQQLSPQQRKTWDEFYTNENKPYQRGNLSGKDLALWKYQRYIKDYLKCILSVDENVGRVLDYLDENGLAENTIVVYTSDQGFYLGEHGWFDKRFMYEESFRTPLLIRYPVKLKGGQREKHLVQNLDFAPTLLDYAGIDIPDDMQGLSLKTLFDAPGPGEWRDALYYHYYEYPAEHSVDRHYGIRTEKYKLIHFYYDTDEWEFYDLDKDLSEMNNLIEDPSLQAEIESLKEQLLKLQYQYKDSIFNVN